MNAYNVADDSYALSGITGFKESKRIGKLRETPHSPWNYFTLVNQIFVFNL